MNKRDIKTICSLKKKNIFGLVVYLEVVRFSIVWVTVMIPKKKRIVFLRPCSTANLPFYLGHLCIEQKSNVGLPTEIRRSNDNGNISIILYF